MTKAERRDAARRERAELLKRQARKRKQRRVFTVVGAVVAAGAIAGAVVLGAGGSSKKHVETGALPGILKTEAPWPANGDQALSRANKIGLPAVAGNYHHHALLDVYINGNKQSIPQYVGLQGQSFASMHTHDTTGIMHMEAARPFDYTLGDFMDVWGVYFTDKCIGAYCDGLGGTLRVYANGKQYQGDPTKLPLKQHTLVVITYGKASQLPSPIPSTYSKSISPSCKPDC
jgi:hypothetical protein